MDTSTIIALGGFLLTVVVLIVSVTWTVGKLNTSTQVLNQTIRSLVKSVDLLRISVEKVDVKVDEHAERISRLEARKPA